MSASAPSRLNPYPGLAPFDEPDAARFFGRDREIDEVLERLPSRRLLAVIGVSGCGKSSLVRAGIIPVLRLGVAPDLPSRWRICTLTPGNAPLPSLASSLGAPSGWPANTFDLVDYARAKLAPGESLLLVVDQFEEIFRFRADTLARDGGNAASLFVNLLLNAVEQREVPVYVLLTMRTDFLGECAQFRGLPEALNDCYYLVPRMTRLQQQDAIERPLQGEGEAIHPALTQRLLNDSAEDPDHLPVLQHLLRRLWENCNARPSGGPIGLGDYREVGGWTGALDADAEAVCRRFPAEEQGIRQVFQWITERGTGERAVRRPRPFAECVEVSGLDRNKLASILSAFEERGLLRPSHHSEESLVDLPHESVTWQWSRMKRWILEEAEQAAQLRFLLQAARRQMLLTGLALESGLQLRAAWRTRPLTALRYFDARELELTDAWIGRSEEFDLNQRTFAEARELSAWAALSLGDDPERSLILGLYSWGKQPAMVAGLEEFLHAALLRSPGRLTLHHQGSVWSVAWSPDGLRLATASSDQSARIWDAQTGAALLTLAGHQGGVSAVAWSPSGGRLATAGFDQTVCVWEAYTGQLLLRLRGHEYAVLGLAWSPDGSRLATSSDDNTVKLWDVSAGLELLTLRGPQAAVWSVAWSPDGHRVAGAGRDQTVRLWNAETGRELHTLRGHEADVRCVAWSPDGARLATASFDNTARIWDAHSGEPLLTLRGHQHFVLSVAWSPDGTRLATAGFDITAKVWDAQTGREWFTLRGHQYAVLCVAWSPDGGKLATASDDNTAKVAELGVGRELSLLQVNRGLAPVWSVAWSPDGTRIATGSDDGTAKIWDALTGREVLALRGFPNYVECVAWSPDSTRLATSLDTTAKVWEIGASRGAGFLLRGHDAYVGAVAWSPDGTKLATGSRDRTAKVWDAESGQRLLRLDGHQADVRSVAWSPDGTTLATASDDCTVIVAKVAETSDPLVLRSHLYPVAAVVWSPDGSKLATASDDKTAILWEAASGKPLLALRGHQAAVTCVAWSPDGSRLATGSGDNTVKVWEAASGRELLTLRGHQLSVRSLSWSPDSTRLASAGDDGIVQVYAVDLTLLLKLVRSRITRGLTQDECRHYLNADQCPVLPEIPGIESPDRRI